MKIHLYNTLTRSKDEFIPLTEGEVKLYSCGPTVYGDPHIGNMRAYFFVDILRSTLEHIGGYEVKHVMNITDVGHLTDDGDHGEDKMEKGARRENKTVWQVARMYESNFISYSQKLHIQSPHVLTRATEYMKEQIDMVHALTEKGYTYIIEGDGIYMDTQKVEGYGKLAQLDFEGMNSDHRGDGARIDSSKKKNLSDFALWKFCESNDPRSMKWLFSGKRAGSLLVSEDFDMETFLHQSKYAKDLATASILSITDLERETVGFPGWHIECSAMASAELGSQIDIHTGGVDHIPVHHTNEIAQAECCLDCDAWVNRWMHGQFLQIDGGKVSKSKGDDLSIPALVELGYDPLDLRFFYCTAHYRSFLDFSWEALDAARKTRHNLIKKITLYIQHGGVIGEPGAFFDHIAAYLADDLDIVSALTSISEALSSPTDQIIGSILDLDDILLKVGLRKGVQALLEKAAQPVPEDVLGLAEARLEAKKEKNYERADVLRDEIASLGRILKDTPDGYDLQKR